MLEEDGQIALELLLGGAPQVPCLSGLPEAIDAPSEAVAVQPAPCFLWARCNLERRARDALFIGRADAEVVEHARQQTVGDRVGRQVTKDEHVPVAAVRRQEFRQSSEHGFGPRPENEVLIIGVRRSDELQVADAPEPLHHERCDPGEIGTIPRSDQEKLSSTSERCPPCREPLVRLENGRACRLSCKRVPLRAIDRHLTDSP